MNDFIDANAHDYIPQQIADITNVEHVRMTKMVLGICEKNS